MKEKELIPVSVNILGKDYRIACLAAHKNSLEDSAHLLNNKMLEIKSGGKVIGSDRIAVMAALNLAHDLLQQRQQIDNDAIMTQRLRQLREKIDGEVSETEQTPSSTTPPNTSKKDSAENSSTNNRSTKDDNTQ